MKNSKIRVKSLSDIHLGHRNTPTASIIDELNIALPDNETMNDVDFIFLVGDLFDLSLVLHDPSVALIERWMYRLLRMCEKRNIVLRVLEGTPAHDRTQPRRFLTIHEETHSKCDFRYVDTLSIEYHIPSGLHLLYIPDEWDHETDNTYHQVKTLMAQQNIEKVDFTLLHGSMDYQLPEIVTSPKHVTQRYLDITRLGVFVGHVHQASQREHLFAHGSFSRLSHGEEEAKGHWDVTFDKHGYQATFVENVKAQRYDTWFINEPIGDTLAYIQKRATLPPGSFIRIQADRDHPILSAMDVLRKHYPDYHWSTKHNDKQTQEHQAKLLVDLRKSYTPIQVGPHNLREILLARIQPELNSPERLTQAQDLLDKLL